MTKRPGKPDAAEYLLGLSDGDISETDAAFGAEVAKWADLLSPLDGGPEPELPTSLWAGIQARVEEIGEMPGIRTVTPETGVWEMIAPGVERKVVNENAADRTLSYFVRLQAGAVLPEHDHPGNEHCVVLEGELQIGSRTFGVGSYQFAQEGQPHPPVTAQSPSLLFIHGPF